MGNGTVSAGISADGIIIAGITWADPAKPVKKRKNAIVKALISDNWC